MAEMMEWRAWLIKFTDKAMLTKTLGAVIKIQTGLSEVSYGQVWGVSVLGSEEWISEDCKGQTKVLWCLWIQCKSHARCMSGINGVASRNVALLRHFKC
jgi:hypothetical protein